MTTIYKITLRGVTGAAYALFEKGMLTQFINELEGNATVLQLMPQLALSEVQFKGLTGITIGELKAKSAADKLALFCFVYQKHKGTTYRTTKEDRANIVHVTVNEHLLNTYFKANQYPLAGLKSIGDYVRHYNEVRDLAANGMPVKNTFPDVYDRQYEQLISADVNKLQSYWAHLRSKGWSKIDGIWKQAVVTIVLLLLTACAYKPKPTKPDKLRPRYESESNQKLNQWLDAEYPRKVVPTVKSKRKRYGKRKVD